MVSISLFKCACCHAYVVFCAICVACSDCGLHYIGMTASTFKERYRNHIKSFNHKRYSNDTELSKYIWKLKDNKQDFDITWSVLKQSISYTGGSKRCNLCLEEKLCILKDKNKQNLLNKKSEIVSTCNHRKKHLINNLRNGRNACIV